MTRVALFAAALAGLLSAAPSRADVEVAPPPREVHPDGTRDPVPAPAPAEDPAETVDRIIKNSKAVGDKLAMTDAGTGTRATQDKILKDIDSLLNPPPQSGGGGGANDKNQDKNDKNNGKDKNDGKDNKGPSGGADQPPKGGAESGSNAKGGPNPKEGSEGRQQANNGERRPRKGGGGQPKDPGNGSPGGKKPDEGMAKGQPMPGAPPSPAGKGDQMAAGGSAGGPTGKVAVKPSLPLDDDVVKEVWGHLPDKLRQQVTQYYKEQFMPRYADLLKQYYSSLANTPQRAGEMRK